MNYPTTFSETLVPLQDVDLDERGQQAIDALKGRGFEVVAGLRVADLSEIQSISHEEGVREYCPKDEGPKRFATKESTEKEWLPKGRGMLQLRSIGDGALAGYGWTGPEQCEELPDCPITFAERLSERFAGNGLGAPFAVAILSGSAALYGSERVGLETWGSNTAAVRTYLRAGAQLITTRDDERPTLKPAKRETDGLRRDVRQFMKFPHTFPVSQQVRNERR
jgi:hypothetical protein